MRQFNVINKHYISPYIDRKEIAHVKIPKTKDRLLLGIIAGCISFIAQTAFDQLSTKRKMSKRSYWSTAAGVWVNNRRQVTNWNGQLLGAWMTFGLNTVNGILMVWTFTKVGLNKWPLKGAVVGSAFGATVNALLSGFKNNKVAPKDSNSNLSYALTNIITGFIAAWSITIFGDKTIFNKKLAKSVTTNQEETLTHPDFIDSVHNQDYTTYFQ
jgi:L-lactate permease